MFFLLWDFNICISKFNQWWGLLEPGLPGTECWGNSWYVSYPSEFPVGFPVLATWEKNKGLSCISLLSGFELISQAYPRETLAHVRAAPIAGSVHELGQQPWWGRFKALFIWWSTRVWITDSLIFCLQNVWLYHRVAQLNCSQKCLAKEKGKTLLVAWTSIRRSEGNLWYLSFFPDFAFQIIIFATFLLQRVRKTEIACKICIS